MAEDDLAAEPGGRRAPRQGPGDGPAQPRLVIAESWSRMRRKGVNPGRAAHAYRGRQSAAATPERGDSDIRQLAAGIIKEYGEAVVRSRAIMVIADGHGRVVARCGSDEMVSAADAIGFVEGALWTEGSVGTNAIGTVLVTRKPQQVNGNEHFLRNQHDWSCAAAPIRDPRTGGVLAVVNISTRAPYAHPLFVATTSAVARITSLEVQERHRRDLAALRSAGFLSQTRAHAVAFVVDQWGWIADAQGFTAPARISLPHGWQPGRQWMAVFGEVDVSAIPGGWLVQSPQTAAAPDGPQVTLHIETSVAGSSAVLRSPSRHLRVAVTPRQVQILEHLASHPEGMSAKELSDALYGRTDRVTTIRAEISRLRRSLGNAIIGNPYRFAPDVAVLGGDNPT